jgi:hypothetical protein
LVRHGRGVVLDASPAVFLGRRSVNIERLESEYKTRLDSEIHNMSSEEYEIFKDFCTKLSDLMDGVKVQTVIVGLSMALHDVCKTLGDEIQKIGEAQ